MVSKEAYELIQQLDLEPIKFKLMHKGSGEGWTYRKACAVEAEYRRFLCMVKLYPDEPIAPVEDVDTFWHYHILDTMKYAVDCDAIFGYFVHHFPYSGMGGEEDEAAMLENAGRIRALYEHTFGPEGVAAGLFDGHRDTETTAPVAQVPAIARDPVRDIAASSAYCITSKPSYCILTSESSYAGAAPRVSYCIKAGRPAKAADILVSERSAYCILTKPGSDAVSARAAYCILAKPGTDATRAAYCILAKPGTDAVATRAAYCIKADKPLQDEVATAAAYCIRPVAGAKPRLQASASMFAA
jgi:hypothetical protein